MNVEAALRTFDALPLAERLFVRFRLRSAPLVDLARAANGHDVLDVGCGHGLVSALIATGRADVQVVGIDPDARKIDWARRSVGQLVNASFEAATIEDLARTRPASFDTIVVADVLYLLPADAWTSFLKAAHVLLRPGGRLALKEAEDDGSWKALKAIAQERLMVHVLRRTKESGGLGFRPRAFVRQAMTDAGFRVVEEKGYRRYSTPHVLFVGESV